MIALGLGCAPSPPEWIGDGPPYTDVTVTIGSEPATVVHLAGAWLADDGSGSGVGASAVLPGAPPLDVVGQRTTWDFGRKRMVFEGAVSAERGDVTLTCDRLEVAYDGARIQTAEATGNVVVSRGARVATGARAVLTADDGRVVLTGDPRIVDGPNRLSGQTITLFLDDERLECDACRLAVDGAAIAPLDE